MIYTLDHEGNYLTEDTLERDIFLKRNTITNKRTSSQSNQPTLVKKQPFRSCKTKVNLSVILILMY